MRLEGIRALVTRPRERAHELCFLLEDEGAEVIALPLLELLPPSDERPLQAVAERIERYAWIAFASPHAVHALVEAARIAGSRDRMRRARIAVVGPQTAKAVRSVGLEVEQEAKVATGEGLADSMRELLHPHDEILIPNAENGRTELADGLRALGNPVTVVAAYRSAPTEVGPDELQALKQSPPDVVFFGSPRTVDAFLALSDDAASVLANTRKIAIGPTTAQAMDARGLLADAVAATPTAEGLVDAAAKALGR